MTRINTIKVKDLLDQHLMAEYREMPMVAGSLNRSLSSKRGVVGIPTNYTLNAGHVKFFYNKKQFLYTRYHELIKELQLRGYSLDPNRESNFHVFDGLEQVSWNPTSLDHLINIERICTRVLEKPNFYRMKGSVIDAYSYVSKLKEKYSDIQ